MEAFDAAYAMPSPANSLSTFYDLDSSASTSPMESAYDMSIAQGYMVSEQAGSANDMNLQDEGQDQGKKPAVKRKRENRYKNAPPSVLSRRRAQNRASQRAYRERKDQRIKDLEVLLQKAHQKNDVLSQAYAALQAEYLSLKAEQEAADAAYQQEAAEAYQQAGVMYDPTVADPNNTMDLYMYNETNPTYPM